MKYPLIILLALVLVGVILYDSTTGELIANVLDETFKRSISFETIDKGIFSGHHDDASYYIIDGESWKELWQETHDFSELAPPVPNVDFSTMRVVGTYLGAKDMSGFATEIVKIYEYRKRIVVVIKDVSPEDSEQAFSRISPFHVVLVDKLDESKKLEFKYEGEGGRDP